jgi:ABC-type transport system substrate-binding protein
VQSTSAINNQAAQVAHQQFQAAGINIRINSVTLPEMLAQTQKGEADLHLGSHPQYDSPGIPLRQAGHRDSRSQFANSGLGDPAIETMIEKSEETTNLEENVRLVKQIQSELLKKYTPYMLLVTQNLEQVLNAKVQNYEQEPSASAAGLQRANLWLST